MCFCHWRGIPFVHKHLEISFDDFIVIGLYVQNSNIILDSLLEKAYRPRSLNLCQSQTRFENDLENYFERMKVA